MDSNYMQIGLKMCEMLWLCQVFCRLNCFFLTLWCTLWKEKLECCDKPNRITWTHVTGNFSGGLGGLEGDSIQPQVIARCLHLLPRRLVNFLHGKRKVTKRFWLSYIFRCGLRIICLYLGLWEAALHRLSAGRWLWLWQSPDHLSVKCTCACRHSFQICTASVI